MDHDPADPAFLARTRGGSLNVPQVDQLKGAVKASGELLAPAGARGVVVRAGYAEAKPEVKVYLVRFEGADKELGPPVGCLADELTQDEPAAAVARTASPPSASL